MSLPPLFESIVIVVVDQVLCPPSSARCELPQEEMRPQQHASPQEEVEVEQLSSALCNEAVDVMTIECPCLRVSFCRQKKSATTCLAYCCHGVTSQVQAFPLFWVLIPQSLALDQIPKHILGIYSPPPPPWSTESSDL
jgi:hypothetical protein